ncbi:MAG: DUF72 domain-containing protein [Deltaproteobacteria bacterium]|nr:DUF72 domain-containing protein [Deltaproteobacteria bacterium]
MSKVFVGTSGYSYPDWVGPVYPPGMPKTDFLTHYAERFDAVEINFTYYRMPTRATLSAMAEKAGGRIRFAVKLTDVFTHARTAGEAEVVEFLRAVEALADRDVLGCLLAQFPWSFRPSDEAREHLRRLAADFAAHPLVVEVRNRAWVSMDFFSFLREIGAGFCCVDEPPLKGLLPPLEVVTSPVAYLRFHGRNAAKWWQHERPEERYDYRYSRDELAPWIPRIRRMQKNAAEVYAFFNNHFEGKAVANATDLLEMLG